ncbi:uncharacterized protein IL334_001911 [Kwoniella shivajii]|uniref:RNA polymerase II elongation factor ELL N-terminal domain-containing protein n=1 Tax=Kwoniella shivajii TaxID=564305 RepID=A0ABZ1CUT8_9TREE|nr:hypothetical protein IL334_001911 [Kwoniella shivajii]
MPLPTSGSIPLIAPRTDQQPNQAYLIKFPEEVWSSLQEYAGGGIEVTVAADGKMTLDIPNLPPTPLDPRSSAIPSELLLYNPNTPSLSLNAIATDRLNIPLSSVSTSRAADKLKAQGDAIDRERKERSVRVEGSAPPLNNNKRNVEKFAPGIGIANASSIMARTNSSPQIKSSTITPAATTNGTGTGTGQMIPLKTRVMQLLALGPTTVSDIIRRVGGDEQNVMRVVNVVGRASSTHPPTYTLLPNQYSKIKLGPGQWKYTYAEQQQVIRLAREAFDELDLSPDAEERAELDRKESELEAGYQSAASSSGSSQEKLLSSTNMTATAATVATVPSVPQNGLSIAPPQSNAPSAARSKSSNGTTSKKTGPQSKIARERAKFMAEKNRSSSLPNTKQPEGTASPRIVPMEIKATPKEKEKEKVEPKEKKTKDNGRIKEKEKGHGKGKGKEVDYSSDDGEDDEPLRGRAMNKEKKAKEDPARKERPTLAERVKEKERAKAKEKERISPTRKKRDYSSSSDSGSGSGSGSEEEGEIRGRPVSKIRRNSSPTRTSTYSTIATFKRKSPPSELVLTSSTKSTSNSASSSTHPFSAPLPKTSLDSNKSGKSTASDPEPDQEKLRDRYEELYPAYQLLTKRLSKIHQAAETGLNVDMDQQEVSKLVNKWEKWHNELQGIRRWFSES